MKCKKNKPFPSQIGFGRGISSQQIVALTRIAVVCLESSLALLSFHGLPYCSEVIATTVRTIYPHTPNK